MTRYRLTRKPKATRVTRQKKAMGETSLPAEEKRRRFAEEFVIDHNAKQAAIRAGYTSRSAYVTGSQLLRYPNVKAYIAELQAKMSAKLAITAENVLHETARVAFTDVDPTEIKASDKLAALSQLGKHLGLFVQRHEVDNRMAILNLNVSAQDLGSARALVEEFRSRPPLIEGHVEPDEDEAKS
jgi:hypothetical protein